MHALHARKVADRGYNVRGTVPAGAHRRRLLRLVQHVRRGIGGVFCTQCPHKSVSEKLTECVCMTHETVSLCSTKLTMAKFSSAVNCQDGKSISATAQFASSEQPQSAPAGIVLAGGSPQYAAPKLMLPLRAVRSACGTRRVRRSRTRSSWLTTGSLYRACMIFVTA